MGSSNDFIALLLAGISVERLTFGVGRRTDALLAVLVHRHGETTKPGFRLPLWRKRYNGGSWGWSELFELKIWFSSATADRFFTSRLPFRISRGNKRFFTIHSREENLVCSRHCEQISNVSLRFTVKYRGLSPPIRF